MGFLSNRRYELIAVAIALVCLLLHTRVNSVPTVGLTGSSDPISRGLQLLEARSYDLRFRFRGAIEPHPAVVVVAIDEKSAQKFGLPPWPRHRMATAVDHLVGAGVKAIALDITYTDEGQDDSSIYRELLTQFDASANGDDKLLADFRAQLAAHSNAASNDAALAKAFRAAGPKLVQGVFTYGTAEEKDFTAEKIVEHDKLLDPVVIRSVPGPGGSTKELPVEAIHANTQRSAQTPLVAFTTQGNSYGYLNVSVDVDGTMRRAAPITKLTGPMGFLPSMAVQAAAVFRDAHVVPHWDEQMQLEAVELKGQAESVSWAVQNEPYALINFVGPGSVFPTMSIADVIDGTFAPAQLKDKLVLVGVTLTGSSGDQRVTPFKELEPGIYGHASVASNLLKGDFMTRPNTLIYLELLSMLLIAIVLARIIPKAKSFAVKGGVVAAFVIVWVVLAQALFSGGVLLATVMPLVNIVSTSFGLIFLGYLSVDREKLKLRSTFTRYLGEDVMEEALKNPDKLNRGEKREMTVLFSDIRGFTTLSERMLPEKLASFINEYLTPMTAIVFDEKGTLDKYIGDAVMAFWNAPIEQPDHAVRACRAAWAMLQKLEELKLKWRAENYPEFDIGVGINTGTMIVGNMGSDVRVDYTVMGDSVNLGSRLEGTNKEYETKIIVGEGTYPFVKDEVILRRLGAVRVKGKRKPVKIYEMRGLGKPQGKEAETIEAFDKGLDEYVAQNWDASEAAFKKVLEVWIDDAPARRYLEEIPQLRANPPGVGWDGVYTATHK